MRVLNEGMSEKNRIRRDPLTLTLTLFEGGGGRLNERVEGWNVICV